MRYLLLLLIYFLTLNGVLTQAIANCGLDNNSLLTTDEASFLNEYLVEKRGDFDFAEKSVVFITGNSGHYIENKATYFTHVRDRLLSNGRVSTFIIVLTEEEKLKTGHDVIVAYWVKVFTKRKRRKVIKHFSKESKI